MLFTRRQLHLSVSQPTGRDLLITLPYRDYNLWNHHWMWRSEHDVGLTPGFHSYGNFYPQWYVERPLSSYSTAVWTSNSYCRIATGSHDFTQRFVPMQHTQINGQVDTRTDICIYSATKDTCPTMTTDVIWSDPITLSVGFRIDLHLDILSHYTAIWLFGGQISEWDIYEYIFLYEIHLIVSVVLYMNFTDTEIHWSG